MLHLNLISQELKQEIKLKRVYVMLKCAGYILIIITALFAVIILIAKIILQNTFNQVIEQTTLITKNNLGNNTQIREINTKLNSIEEIQNDFTAWSFLLKDLFQDISPGINFSLIKIDKEKQKIELKGISKTRNDLLDLEKSMQKSNKFTDINFPIKNILTKENINFEITAKINYKEL